MEYNNSRNFPGDVLNAHSQYEIPEIYRLIEINAGVHEIVASIFKNSAEPKSLYFAFKHLIDMGLNGDATIRYIAQSDTGNVGGIAQKILDRKSNPTSRELEIIVGMSP